MNIRLLKINAMKRFCRWLNTNRVATYLWDMFNPVGKIYLGLERRQQAADERDQFVEERRKIRPNWRWTFERQNQFIMATRLLEFVTLRHENKKKK
jgi:hypothetical protein